MEIKWTLRKRLMIGAMALLVQWQAMREALRPADPYADPDYVPASLRLPGEQAILAAGPGDGADSLVFG